MKKLNGLIAAAFTPFKCGEVNVEVIPAYAEYLASNGISGVFVNGTTGESLSLSFRERMDQADAWLRTAPANLKVVIHVGGTALPDCCKMAQHAAGGGAGAISAMAPGFFKPSLKELVDFTAEIAAAAPELPFYYYHMPSMTGVSFPMIDYLRAAGPRIPNLAGIKFTFEDLMDYGLCVDHKEGKYDMVFGRDEVLLCGLSLGAQAAIGSTYNFAAPLYLSLLEAASAGDMKKARTLQLLSMELVAACVRATSRGLPAIRALTEWRSGLTFGPMRAPISPLDREALTKLKEEAQVLAGFLLSNPCEPVVSMKPTI